MFLGYERITDWLESFNNSPSEGPPYTMLTFFPDLVNPILVCSLIGIKWIPSIIKKTLCVLVVFFSFSIFFLGPANSDRVTLEICWGYWLWAVSASLLMVLFTRIKKRDIHETSAELDADL